MPVSPDDALVFSLYAESPLTERANKELKRIVQEFILMANERFCSDCFWLLKTDGFYDMADTPVAEYPFIRMTEIEGDWTFLLLDKIDANIFTLLMEAKDLYGYKLNLDVGDIDFTAYHPADINNLNLYEASGFFDKQIMEFEIEFIIGGKHSPNILITYKPSRGNYIKECLIDVFGAHDIELEFICEDKT